MNQIKKTLMNYLTRYKQKTTKSKIAFVEMIIEALNEKRIQDCAKNLNYLFLNGGTLHLESEDDANFIVNKIPNRKGDAYQEIKLKEMSLIYGKEIHQCYVIWGNSRVSREILEFIEFKQALIEYKKTLDKVEEALKVAV